ncbi:MAG: Rab family GTPase [Promethearchaeota archaeon]
MTKYGYDKNNNKFDDNFDDIYNLIKDSCIKGVVFSIYENYGPQTLYTFPPPQYSNNIKSRFTEETKIQTNNLDSFSINNSSFNEPINKSKKNYLIPSFTSRDFLQISVKNVSLLIGEKILNRDPELLNKYLFGILPYPDLKVYAYTSFRFFKYKNTQETSACTLSLLIDEKKRSFIYENIVFLKEILQKTANSLVYYLENGKWSLNTNNPEILKNIRIIFYDFFYKIKIAEERAASPITSKYLLKIVFAGLKGVGKTSFLLTSNRRYRSLTQREFPYEETIKIANMLGVTIMEWDIDEFLDKTKLEDESEIFLYDVNLIYYFIECTNIDKLELNKKCLNKILQICYENRLKIPIVIIITKADKDIVNQPEIKENIKKIKTEFSKIILEYNMSFKFYQVSIFDYSSIISSFSYGIRQLNPNLELISYKLKEYSTKLNALAILFFNKYGLIIDEFISENVFKGENFDKFKSILQSLPHQYIGMYEMFLKEFSNLNDNYFIINTLLDSNSSIILKKIEIEGIEIYCLIYLKELNKNKVEKKEICDKMILEMKDLLASYALESIS